MTIAERNEMLKALITCMKCEVSGNPCDDNCPTQYEAGHTGEIIENLEAISKLLEQQPCEDCISRQAVLDIINFEDKWLLDAKSNNANTDIAFSTIKSKLSKMPSVIPKGVTITDFADKCKECGREKVLDKIRAEIMDFEEELFHRPNTDYTDYAAVRHCVEIIDKYKEVDGEYKESKWVKVEDELPELYREVWLSCRDYEVWLSCRGYKKVVRGYLSPDYHKSWYVYDSECGYYNINNAKAWMYVERPKPYKAEREDKKWQIGW